MPTVPSATQRHRHRSLAIAGATVLLPFALSLAISFAVTPEQIESGAVVVAPTCTFKRIFGRPCPTCGRPYRQHPLLATFDWLNVLCDGTLVKL